MPANDAAHDGAGIISVNHDRNAEIGRLYLSGVSTKQLAERFGLKTPAITRTLNKIGVVPHKQGRRHDDAMAELVANGMTQRAAAAELGITEQRASQLWARIRAGLGWQAI